MYLNKSHVGCSYPYSHPPKNSKMSINRDSLAQYTTPSKLLILSDFFLLCVIIISLTIFLFNPYIPSSYLSLNLFSGGKSHLRIAYTTLLTSSFIWLSKLVPSSRECRFFNLFTAKIFFFLISN